MLPHRYPFVFVDLVSDPSTGTDEGRAVVVRITQGAGPLRGAPELPSILAIEMIAQASAASEVAVEADGPKIGSVTAAAKPVHLAGFEASFSESLAAEPMTAGDELEIRLEESRGFGGLHKVAGRLLRLRQDGSKELLVEAELMLTK